jgi:hypothetical protein
LRRWNAIVFGVFGLEEIAMSDNYSEAAEIDDRIAAVRENIRQLVEQAAAYSGAADDELSARRIAAQEEKLEELIRQRDALSQPKP